jgi:hypothetical protein
MVDQLVYFSRQGILYILILVSGGQVTALCDNTGMISCSWVESVSWLGPLHREVDRAKGSKADYWLVLYPE